MKKELTITELKEQGYKFYTWEEASERFGVNLVKTNNRGINIDRNIEGKYEYQTQKKSKPKGLVAGIWIKESDNVFTYICKTKKSQEAYDRLLDFYLSNHVDFLTQDEIAEKTKVSKSTIVSFETFCREIGLMEEQTEPVYKEVYNQCTGKMEQREVPTMTQYYYVSVNGQTGKLATSSQYYGRCWNWIYKRAEKISKEFLKKKPQYTFVTEEVYKGFKKQAEAEFNKLFGHKVRRGSTRKINIEKLVELGIDKKFSLEPLPTEKTYKAEALDFKVIENDVYDITVATETEPKETKINTVFVPTNSIGFGRQAQFNIEILEPSSIGGFGRQVHFNAQILEPSVIDGSFLVA